MVINDNNKEQENMLNKEQENYTGEHQEEGWFAKNKTVVIAICLFIAALGFWAFSSRNTEPANPANAETESKSTTTYFDETWKYLVKTPSWKELGIAAAGVASLAWLNKRFKVTKTIATKVKGWWKKSP